mgnify:CR=1 FL=1
MNCSALARLRARHGVAGDAYIHGSSRSDSRLAYRSVQIGRRFRPDFVVDRAVRPGEPRDGFLHPGHERAARRRRATGRGVDRRRWPSASRGSGPCTRESSRRRPYTHGRNRRSTRRAPPGAEREALSWRESDVGEPGVEPAVAPLEPVAGVAQSTIRTRPSRLPIPPESGRPIPGGRRRSTRGSGVAGSRQVAVARHQSDDQAASVDHAHAPLASRPPRGPTLPGPQGPVGIARLRSRRRTVDALQSKRPATLCHRELLVEIEATQCVDGQCVVAEGICTLGNVDQRCDAPVSSVNASLCLPPSPLGAARDGSGSRRASPTRLSPRRHGRRTAATADEWRSVTNEARRLWRPAPSAARRSPAQPSRAVSPPCCPRPGVTVMPSSLWGLAAVCRSTRLTVLTLLRTRGDPALLLAACRTSSPSCAAFEEGAAGLALQSKRRGAPRRAEPGHALPWTRTPCTPPTGCWQGPPASVFTLWLVDARARATTRRFKRRAARRALHRLTGG